MEDIFKKLDMALNIQKELILICINEFLNLNYKKVSFLLNLIVYTVRRN